MRGEQAIFNLEIKKKSGLTINPDIHHSKVFSSGQFVFTMVKKISQIPQNIGGGGGDTSIKNLFLVVLHDDMDPGADGLVDQLQREQCVGGYCSGSTHSYLKTCKFQPQSLHTLFFSEITKFYRVHGTAAFRHNVLKLLSTGSNLIYMIGSIAHTK